MNCDVWLFLDKWRLYFHDNNQNMQSGSVDPTIWFTAQHGSSTTLSCSMWHTTVANYRRYRVLRRESLRVLANQKERSKVTGIAILVNYGNGKTWKSGHFPYPATLCHSPNKRCEDSTKVSKALNSPCENICHEASPGCFSLSSSYALALHKTPGAPSTHLTHPRTSENLKPNFKEDLSKWRFGLCFLRWTCKFVAFVTWLQVRNAFPPLLILINTTITLREIGHFVGHLLWHSMPWWIPLTVSDSLVIRLRASPPEVMCPWVHHRHSQQQRQRQQ